MRNNFTAIAAIIDASGSMVGLTNDTIGNFNKFLEEQKAVPGDAAFSLCIFNSHSVMVHDFADLKDVPPLNTSTYRTTGMTALNDAIGSTINSLGNKLSSLPEEERPSKVVVMIITDGEENSSHSFTTNQIKEMVQHQTDKYSWQFLFLAANLDAVAVGGTFGVRSCNSINYMADSAGTEAIYSGLSDLTTRYRSSSDGASVNATDVFDQGTGVKNS